MEDVDIKYENGVIYMIKHKTDDTKEFYIGSSKNFKKRCGSHKTACNNQNSKKYNLKVYKYIRENDGWDCWNMNVLYDYPCKNKYKLELEEQLAVKKYKSTLNKIIPRRTKKEYREDNIERLKEYKKEHYKDNKEIAGQYYKNNKEKILQREKEYRQNNKEEIAEKDKKRYQKNKEEILQKKKEHYEANKKKIAEKNKELYETNKEEIAEKRKIKINCDICNRLVRKSDIATHKKTNYCMNYQKSLV